MIYVFFYHIPSAMTDGKWNHIQALYNNPKHAAKHAVETHFRGSEYPAECEVWIARKIVRSSQPTGLIQKFMAFEGEGRQYRLQKLDKKDKVPG